jgi:regulator of protease activity HflC (stomatin/prohibitin superfamily)
VAEQGILESEHKAEQVRQLARGNADAAIIQAQADAQATQVRAQAEAAALTAISNALKDDKNLLTYRYIEKLSPAIRVMLVPNNAPYLLPLPELNATDAITATIPPTLALTTDTIPAADSTITTLSPLTGTAQANK